MREASFVVLSKMRDALASVLLVLLQKKHGPIVLCALVLEVEAVACSLGCEPLSAIARCHPAYRIQAHPAAVQAGRPDILPEVFMPV